MKITVNLAEMQRVINSEHKDPFSVLGMHEVVVKEDSKSTKDKKDKIAKDKKVNITKAGIAVRAFIPSAREIYVIDCKNPEKKLKMDKIHNAGFFELAMFNRKNFFKYLLHIVYNNDSEQQIVDPYSFWPIITEYDTYLFNQGKNYRVYEKMGAHAYEVDGIKGVLFAVWAPTAKRVSVIGNFNVWDGRRHQMRMVGSSGIWEIFIPGLNKGELYKFEIKTNKGVVMSKADPYAFYAELRPKTASVVWDSPEYKWNDNNWMDQRQQYNNFESPMSIYEAHLGSWRKNPEGDRFFTYRELADELVDYVKEMGYTHIELMPICEHPFDGSWGYQITGYFAVTSRYGTPEDFMYFIDKCHQNGIGVIMDWVPAHFPKDAHGLARFDGTALYEHEHPQQGEHPDWGTLIFNYGRNEVKNFLISNAVYWFDKYHIDGLRVDAVASMLYLDYGKKEGEYICNRWGGKENIDAIDFMRELNSTVYNNFSGIMMIAEESTSWAMVCKPPHVGGLGYGFKWNMGWMNDFLLYMSKDPIYKKYHHNNITFSFLYAFSENFILVLSHDEVVHGKCSLLSKMPGDYWQKFANLRAAYGFMYAHPGKKLLFMGGEFGQFIEWDYKKSLDWHLLGYDMHAKMQRYVKDLNKLYLNEKSLWEQDCCPEGFEWIDGSDTEHSVIAFIRKAKNWKDMLVVVCNYTPVVYEGYRVGVPLGGYYKEVLNSDSEIYGGSNQGNSGGLHAQNYPWQGKSHSLELRIPPLGVVILKPTLE